MILEMELIPTLEVGWFNGWILLCLLYLILSFLYWAFPKDVVRRIWNKSGRSKRQKVFICIGSLLCFVYFALIIFSPLKIGSNVFIIGTILYALGLAGFVIALFNFKNAPLNQPVSRGLYRISRNPQQLMFFISFFGICFAIGSWLALFIQIMSSLFLHFRVLAEEKACLERYGDSYRAYMKRVPRYFLIKTHMRKEGKNEKFRKKVEKFEEEISENIINIPNFFTTIRVIITFIIIYMIFADFSIVWIAIFFIVGMITDAIDGNAARIFNMKTEFGRKYDMIADRFLFAGTIFAILIHYNQTGFFGVIETVQIFCIMSREIIGLPAAVWAFFSGNVTPRIKVIGKTTTVLQAIALPSVILKLSFAWPAAILTGVVGIISGLTYIRDTRKLPGNEK